MQINKKRGTEKVPGIKDRERRRDRETERRRERKREKPREEERGREEERDREKKRESSCQLWFDIGRWIGGEDSMVCG